MVFTHNINPTILSIGPLQIRWYGLMYVLGFLFAYFYARAAIKKGKLKITIKELDLLIIYLAIALVTGARIGQILFYEPTYYFKHPLKMFAIWEGGLSFHGGLIGVLLTGWWFSKKKKIPFLQLCDVFAVPAALGNALGRIGNFINGELYGRLTNLPWGVVFPGAKGARHPTQLYEAAYNLVNFSILLPLRNKTYKHGTLLAIFLIVYSTARFFVEFVKEIPQVLGPLTMGQVLSIPMLIIGLWLLLRK